MCIKLICYVYLLFIPTISMALSDNEINEIKSHFGERKQKILTSQIANPDPTYEGHKQEPMRYAFNRLNYAIACLFMNQNIEQANQAVIDAIDMITKPENSSFYYIGEAGLHWQGAVLGRLYLFFGDNPLIETRLNKAASEKVLKALWDWTYQNSNADDTEYIESRTWYIWGSENHDIMHDSLCWMASKIFKDSKLYNQNEYKDGTIAVQQYEKWNEYFVHYLSERGKRGLFAEIDSTTYSKHTLQCVYNLYDFSEPQSELKHLAKSVLDLWWADWAAEQINSFRGGSKLRIYRDGSIYNLGPCQNAMYQSGRLFSWIYMGIGEQASRNSCVMGAATSDYMVPDVVIDIALDTKGRGEYEYISCRPAANLQPRPQSVGQYNDTGLYALNPDWNGKLKYSYCTPAFIMGCDMCPKLPDEDWYAWGQNLWAGILFSGSPEAIIYPEAMTTSGERGTTYNQHWAVQRKNTMIVQRNKEGWTVGDMRVWFADCLSRQEEDGWIFVKADKAYAAVKVVFGGFEWDDNNWLRLKDKDSPIIFEVAAMDKYADFEAFKGDVKNNVLIVQGDPSSQEKAKTDTFALRDDILYYEGILNSGRFTFYFRSGRAPEIDNIPVSYAPDFTFKSPFINQYPYASDKVTIAKGNRKLEIGFDIN